MEHTASVRVPQFGRGNPKAVEGEAPPSIASLKHEDVSNNYGRLSVEVLTQRFVDSEYVVSVITGTKMDRSLWFKIKDQSNLLHTDLYARLHSLAQAAGKNLLRRTRDKFGRGAPPAMLLVQSLSMGSEGAEKFLLMPGAVVIPYDA